LIAAFTVLAPACDGTADDCACHLPLGPYVDEEGRGYEIEVSTYNGHRWYMLPKCVKCGHRFAAPDIGLVCCICLAGKKCDVPMQEVAEVNLAKLLDK
jgi:hypothetical protein